MIKSLPKKLIKRWLATRGYKISWTGPEQLTGTDLPRDLGVLIQEIGPVCFDVGANKGQTIQMLTSSLRSPWVHSFEPTPALYEGLMRAAWGERVRVHQLALGSAKSVMQLHTYALNELNSLLPLTSGTANPFGDVVPTGSVSVDVQTVDAFCDGHQIQTIDLLKIDTQGFDLEALKGASMMLAGRRVKHVLIELNFIDLYTSQCSPWDVQVFLSDQGFRLVDYYEKNRQGLPLGWCTALFQLESVASLPR